MKIQKLPVPSNADIKILIKRLRCARKGGKIPPYTFRARGKMLLIFEGDDLVRSKFEKILKEAT